MPEPFKFDIETINALGSKLFDHAEDAIRRDVAAELKMAARVCDKLAGLRQAVAEIAEKAISHPKWDGAAFARDLREALERAEGGEL